MRKKPKFLRGFMRKYRLGFVCIITIVSAWTLSAIYYVDYANKQQSSRLAVAEEQRVTMEETISRLRAEKITKLKLEEAKKEREAKEAAEVEAKRKAAEEAKQAAASPTITVIPSLTCNRAAAHNDPASIDVLVNKKHCVQPLSFGPNDLIVTNGVMISARAAGDFNRMFADAAAVGQPFRVTSGYRSYGTQVTTYNYWVSVNGQRGADEVSARPGYSEHQTGLAIDVAANGCSLNCFGTTSQYQWFQANAATYGFVQRYYRGYETIT